jgi:hypothetical protein
MEIKQVTEVIGYRIVGTGIFCTYGELNDSIIEIVQDYMKERKENSSVIDVFKKEWYIEVCIFYCSEHKAKDRYDFSVGDVIWIFNSFEEFACFNNIDDKFKSLDDINEADRKRLRSHNNGYVSQIIY